MKVEVINTGTELLLGQVTNTHVGYFGEQLLELGLRIERQTSVPDGDAIQAILKQAIERSDLILVTGGLGPTSDDITRELSAELLGLDLVEDEAVTADIRSMIEKLGKPMREINRRQAMVPKGAEVLWNDYGTAPGLYFPAGLVASSPHIFLLPGPPRELKPMFQSAVRPRLQVSLADAGITVPDCANHFFVGLGESELASRIEPALSAHLDRFELGYCLKAGGIIVRCIGSKEVLDEIAPMIRGASPKDYVCDGEPVLEKVVVEELDRQGQTVATAESCTGGMIASRITDVAGSSAVFGFGWVTYANEAKAGELGVKAELIAEHGAVSEPVVRAMVEGCLKESGADHALAVTGIAGPGGGTPEKPVGTVWIGMASQSAATIAEQRLFKTDRAHFKLRTSGTALDLLRRRLHGYC